MCLIVSLMDQQNTKIQVQEQSNGELLKQRIEEAKESQKETSLEISEDEIEINNDYKEVQKIVTKDTKGKKEYEEYYGGMYMTEEGELVVQIVDASTNEKKNIINNTSNKVVINEVENSYNDLQETYKEISKKFQDCVENEQDNKELKALTDNMIGVSIDQERNAIVVNLETVSDEAKVLFEKYYGNDNVILGNCETNA